MLVGRRASRRYRQIKPDMVSSYIYYHYQKQEESPDSFNQSYA
ncbi:hypothetical protein QFZ78_002365 [Paenibacillus sp. V4I5]|nr:hypothetical protein [Paenibacillus sp. V4I5]